MGVGGQKKPLPEIDETRAAGRDAAFDAIIEKVVAAGGEVIEDETHPLYTDIGMDQFEIGTERTVEFTLNKTDFQLIRKVETSVLQGSGHQKHLEELDVPRSRNMLKKRSLDTGEWMTVDLEDMF